MNLLATMLKDWLTSADGETYAIGRAYSVLFVLVGLALPFALIVAGYKLTLNELSVYLPALAGAIALLVTGTNPTEPK
jgi:hypothetical protein